MLAELVLVLEHTLLKVVADLFEPDDVAVLARGELSSQLFHACFARDLLSKHLNLGFHVIVKSLPHLILVLGSTSLVFFSLKEEEGLHSPDFLDFVEHLGRVLE